MADLSGSCAIDECSEPAKALVVTDLEIMEDETLVDYDTQLIPMCQQHAIEELSD